MDEVMQKMALTKADEHLNTIIIETDTIMKYQKKAIPIVCAAAVCATLLAVPSAQANLITGSIGFGASGVTIDNSTLANATSFSVADPFTTVETGTYSAVPMFTFVTFNGFKFHPPVATITPLWTFDIGATVYSFDATSVSSSFNSSLDEWDIGGNGIAMVTGYTPTDGSWNVNLSQSGASFVFDSSAAAKVVVPDNGSSMAMLGSALLGLGMFSRKFCC
jgi:hypothetical protein